MVFVAWRAHIRQRRKRGVEGVLNTASQRNPPAMNESIFICKKMDVGLVADGRMGECMGRGELTANQRSQNPLNSALLRVFLYISRSLVYSHSLD